MNVQRLLMDNDLIYIDTASLMNTSNLQNFLSNYEEEFAKSQNMIIVPEAVCQELIRHINSGNEEKSAKAIKALNIIREYNSIFTLEQSNFSPEEIQHAFADQELLVRLAKERRYKKQLLITNDRSLSKDAFDLNLLQSCRGKEISVCYMNYYGQLNPSKFESESVSDMDFPVITKPADGSGSHGFSVCRSRFELDRGYSYAMDNSPTGTVIIEQFVPNESIVVIYTVSEGKLLFSTRWTF